MSDEAAFQEDLSRLAAESFELAGQLCRSCGDMHALGPYIRLARGWEGVEPPSSPLPSRLTEFIAAGRKKVLIAGSQDTGLLALVARAGTDGPLAITVVDRCATPLELCRRRARQWNMPIETVQEDLSDFAMRECFDIVLVHFTLQHIAHEYRADVLGRLCRALCRSGRLLLSFHTSRTVESALGSESRDQFADWVIQELERIPVALPEAREAFHARLRARAQDHVERQGAFSEPEDVDALLTGAGLRPCERFEIGLKRVNPVQNLIEKIKRRRFLVIAEPAP